MLLLISDKSKMSTYNWSQSLLTHPMTTSLDERDSQDSGIGSQNYNARPQLFPPAGTRRTLPKPPSLPNLNESGRWKFSRQNPDRQQQGSQELQLMRDMHGHLLEIDEAVARKMTHKMSTIVKECVKHLQNSNAKQSEKSKLIIDELKTSTETVLHQISASDEKLASIEKMLVDLKDELNCMIGEHPDLDRKLELALKMLSDLSEEVDNLDNVRNGENLSSLDMNKENLDFKSQLKTRSSPSVLPPVRIFQDNLANKEDPIIIKGENSDIIDSCQ